jgi:hypothetical protein
MAEGFSPHNENLTLTGIHEIKTCIQYTCQFHQNVFVDHRLIKLPMCSLVQALDEESPLIA